MKRVFASTLSLCLILLLLSLCCSALAADRDHSLSGNPLVVDLAELLTDSEQQALERKAQAISAAHSSEVIILTVYGTGGETPQDFAEAYFTDHDYGFGADRSGILFLLSMEERDWHIATHGSTIYAFPDDDIDFLFSRCKEDLADGSYADAFESYLDYSEKILSVYDGTISQSDKDDINAEFNAFMHGEEAPSKPNYVKKGIISVILGALTGFIPVGMQKSELKTVRKRRDASGYARPGSLNLFVNRDIYLYSNVTSHVIEQPRSDSGGSYSIGSGHSTTHTSSSGSTFGGHGGKF